MKYYSSIQRRVDIALFLLVLGVMIGLYCFGCSSLRTNYSPLDSYIKASVESHEANVKAEREARIWLDSINHK